MVYAVINRTGRNGGSKLLSTGQVLERLGITKQTLYKWIILGKVKAIKHEIGRRIFLEFDPKEILKIEASLKTSKQRKDEKGRSLFKDVL